MVCVVDPELKSFFETTFFETSLHGEITRKVRDKLLPLLYAKTNEKIPDAVFSSTAQQAPLILTNLLSAINAIFVDEANSPVRLIEVNFSLRLPLSFSLNPKLAYVLTLGRTISKH